MPADTPHNLEAPANVLWVRVSEIAQREIAGAQTKHYSELRNAIRFIMEDMAVIDRSVAWITTDTGSIAMPQIEGLYREIVMKG